MDADTASKGAGRPYVRGRVRAGDTVHWYYHYDHIQEGRVLEVKAGGEWAWVVYGTEGYVTMLETCRLRILRSSRASA